MKTKHTSVFISLGLIAALGVTLSVHKLKPALTVGSSRSSGTASSPPAFSGALSLASSMTSSAVSSLDEKRDGSQEPSVQLVSHAQTLTARVRDLSLVVLPNEAQKQALNSMLANKDLQHAIRSKLLDPSALSDAHFSERSALLDVLYEGLNSQDGAVSSTYLDLAEDILTTPAVPEVKASKSRLVQYFGDRVEIAMVVAKISKQSLTRLRARSVSQNPETAHIFDRASKLQSVYEVSL